jgi:alkaline phosphatase
MHPEMEHNEPKLERLRSEKSLEDEVKSEYWLNKAKNFVQEQLKKMPNTKKAKNVILFLGDGMSHPTVAAARVYMGGEEKKLSFESLPFTASSKTYCVDVQVADSACTATAFLSGVKTNDGILGLGARALLGNCADSNDAGKKTESIASWAMKAGKDAGLVTTTRVTHATPGALYANIAHRDWEDDYYIREDGCNPALINDIAEQLIYGDVGRKLKVVLGGGSRNFINSTFFENGGRGYRSDGKHLINEWRAADAERTFVNSKQNLMNVNPTTVKQLLGLFSSSHLPFNLDVKRDNLQEIPSLTEMTEKAIDILSQNPEGYFLLVEGGRIDHGHHETRAKYAVDETAEFSKAIEAALAKVNTEETLVIVTADHSHVMSLAGYAVSLNHF